MELLSQIGISPNLPQPPGPGVPQAAEAAGAKVPDIAMYSLEGIVRTRHQAGPATALLDGAPDFCNHLREL